MMNWLLGTTVYAAELPIIVALKENILNPILKLLIGAAVIYFLYGVVQFMQNREDEEKRAHLLWGVVGVAVMVSVFGIINLIGSLIQSLK